MYFKISSIRRMENEPLSVVTLTASGGDEAKTEKLVVFSDFCPENGIGLGECDEDTARSLRDCAGVTEAYRRGERLLAYSANSERVLITKLRSKGVSAEHAREATRMLAERGFIDDRENVLAEAEKCVKKLWGPRRIMAELSAKGYRGEVLNEARAYLEDVDFSESLAVLIEKKYRRILLAGDEKDMEKTVAALVRYGYTPRESLSAVRRLKWQK